MLTGTVTATNGGQTLAGLTVTGGGASTSTSASGSFALPFAGASMRLDLAGAIVPRVVYRSSPATVDAIVLGAGFDLGFYRQFVRNGFEQSGSLQPLRRWTRAPSIYIRTVDEAGVPIDAVTLNTTSAAIQDTAAIWSGGSFGVAGVTLGTETREGQSGWITVKWPAVVPADNFCGRAPVGQDGGYIELDYKTPGCSCNGSQIRPRTVRHELGHALGYWHTDSAADLMFHTGSTCDQQPSARERAHAVIAYQRPIGNVDPDTDPSSTLSLQSLPRLVID
jgi:hypothetical protein